MLSNIHPRQELLIHDKPSAASKCRMPKRRGATVVEFAVIVPLLFLLTFALLEMGRMFMVIHGLETSAREGCRVAISYEATEQEVQDTVAKRLETFAIEGSTVTISPDSLAVAKQFTPVTVHISVPYKNVSLIPSFTFFTESTVGSSCTLTKESNKKMN